MIFSHRQLQKGYTLVELLVYVFIFSIVAIVVINAVVVSLSTFATARVHRKMANAGLDAMERMTREVRSAVAVDELNSTFDVDAGALTIDVIEEEAAVEKTFEVVDGVLRFSEDGVDVGALTSDDIVVDAFNVSYLTSAQSQAVKIALEISHASHGEQSETFYTTVGLRGSY